MKSCGDRSEGIEARVRMMITRAEKMVLIRFLGLRECSDFWMFWREPEKLKSLS